ncbi:DNA phosphorothioation-associated putative methyltransferase [Shewanella algae]|uniref:DNA phosphorothioation-associated putative methyltransferase n=1 Tax=Shewanella algae TaxID=38313 RepID=UPI00300773E4
MLTQEQYLQRVTELKVGKQLPDAVYLHADALSNQDKQLFDFANAIAKALNVNPGDWNVAKLFTSDFRISLLNYPTFYTDAYPALVQSTTVNLRELSHRTISYESTDNAPILHRKELMVGRDSPYYDEFSLITQEGENAGLYEQTKTIGFKLSWENHIARHGYTLVDGRLFRTSMLPNDEQEKLIDRHKTAIVRHALSAPMKSLVKHGFLTGDYSLFDYGCGRGDDLRELLAHGIDAAGWDPNHFPEGEIINADVVNLGFVLNVIEDKAERNEALSNAWGFADKLLVVSVMLANETFINRFTPYKDGVITSRNTFQKYYSQAEIKAYIERCLDEEAIAVAPGIFYVFKDKNEEQRCQQQRYSRSHQWQQLSTTYTPGNTDKAKLIIAQHQPLFDEFWQTCLKLGRLPISEEFPRSDETKNLLGSHRRVFSVLQSLERATAFEAAQQQRKEDLLLYFAMTLFSKRKPYSQQPVTLKNDIKAFFNDYKTALNQAEGLLGTIADQTLIEDACKQAHQTLPASVYNVGHSLVFHKSYFEKIPLILRTYVAAALQLYGEIDEQVDLIKIHTTSGKLTLTAYDDYEQSVPFLVERIKIKMAEQEIDFFDYVDESKRPPLLNKHLYMNAADISYQKQKSFDQRLARLFNDEYTQELFYRRIEFDIMLAKNHKKIMGYRIVTQ